MGILKVMVGILVGLSLGIVTTNWWYQRQFSDVVVDGPIQYQEKVKFDSWIPAPPGYYIQSRVYLQYDGSPWLGKDVSLKGKISTIGKTLAGNTSGNYPIVTDIEHMYVKGEKGLLRPLKISRDDMKHIWIGDPNPNEVAK